MSRYYSLFLIIFFLQITYLYSTPLNTLRNDEINDIQNTVHYLIKNYLYETNYNDQILLLNQLREYLNRMCIIGYFGSTHAHACQRIVDIVHQLNKTDDETNVTPIHDDINNEQHDIKKRFFCNGFIGCRSSGR